MAYTTIDKSTGHFNTVLWTGNSGTQSITGVGFQPDFIWGKVRADNNNTGENGHILTDAVRGNTKYLQSNSTNAEATNSYTFTSFDSDGFSLGNKAELNSNTNTYASWNWKAGGSGSSNSNGSVTSTVSANTTAGFSIVKFNVGSSGGNITVGHGLGAVPKMIIIKSLTDSYNWDVYHENVGNGNRLILNGNNASSSSTFMSSTSPTSSVFTFKQNHYSNNADAVAYCFVEKTGFSKFGSYTGIDASDNAFVYCGFAPSWIMFKRTDSSNSWGMFDNKRDTISPNTACLDAENADEESSVGDVDFLSNGFKIRSASGLNGDGQYIYMAFGQSLVGSNNVPVTAR